MDVSSVQEDNQICRSSSPKQPTSELKHEFDYKDICCVSAKRTTESSENVGKETAETREISSPQQTTSDLNHEFGSESMNIAVLQKKQVSPLENTNTIIEEFGPPVDYVSKNQGRGQLEAIQEGAIHNTSKLGHGEKGEASATNPIPEELGPLPDDVSKTQGRGPLEPNCQVLEDVPADSHPEESVLPNDVSSSQLLEGSGPPPEYQSRNHGVGQLEPMQEDAVTGFNPQACDSPYYESKNRIFGQLEQMQDVTHPACQSGQGEKGEDETINSDPEELGVAPDDASKNQGLEQLEPMQEDAAINSNPEEDATHPTSQSGQGEKGEDVTTDSHLEESRAPPDDMSKNQGLEQLESMQEDAAAHSSPEELGPPPNDVSKNQDLEQLEPMQEDATQHTSQWGPLEKGEDAARKSSCKESGPPLEDVSKNQGLGRIELMQEVANPNPSQSEHGENGEYIARNSSCKESGPRLEDVSKNQGVADIELMQEVANPNSSQSEHRENGEDTTRNYNPDESGAPPGDMSKNNSLEQLEPMQEDATQNPNSSQSEHGENGEDTARNSNPEESGPPPGDMSKNNGLRQLEPREGKNKSRPLGSPRALRSRSEEKSKAPEVSTNLGEHFSNKEKKRRKKKKKKKMKNVPVNEFSRIRTHLRYLLTRMQYEQNFIDAYCGEGWKGQSLEKIKPEKELQRAKSEIFRCKLKIRDLFQRLHMSCAEGRLPENLFDSEGEIDSEDIFCAKCGSKELPANNDIILCDGSCERGFHQFCLDPPLLNEDIPPDDEGWLCPGCDCKVDCIELLNDSRGMNLSIADSWEEVFPEAAAAASGNNMADTSGLPSDDSEDDDYNPEGPQLDKEMQGVESNSDESDFSSASDDLGALPINDPYAGLPSDDSEDDDYNPNLQNLDDEDNRQEESSSSDFTSDSEYFSAGSDDNRPPDEVQGSNGERSELGGMKKQTLSDELLSLLEPGTGGGDSAPLSGKRHVQRLDYKRLHDETYGNLSSDSSDEDYMDAIAAPKRRKTNNGEVASVLPNRKTQNNGSVDIKYNEKESEQTPKRRTSKKLDDEATGGSPAKSHQGSSGPDSCSKSTTRSANKRLGEAVTQRLLESFKENHFPGREVKENLATELSLTVKQVSKWFENARWSFNHTSRMDSKLAESASRNGSRANNQTRPTKSRKSIVKSDNGKTDDVKEMTQNQNVDDNTPKVQELQRSGRVQSKSTDSGS